MMDVLYSYFDRFLFEVHFNAFIACAIAISVILVLWGVLFLTQSYGYMSKFIFGVKRANRFLDKHLVITDYNADEFFEKCIKEMPLAYQKGWRNFYSKRDVSTKNGGVGVFFEGAAQKRTADYANSVAVLTYRLVSFAAGIFALGMCYYVGISAISCIFISVVLLSVYILLSTLLRLKQYATELKFNRKNDELIFIIESFTKFKSQIEPLSHKLSNDKPVVSIEQKSSAIQNPTTVSNGFLVK